MSTHTPIGFIGFGVMGASMARHLRAKGHQVYGYSRSPEKVAALTIEGIVPVASLKELSSKAGVVVLAVTDGVAVEEILFGSGRLAEHLAQDSLIIDTSTIASSEAISIGRRCRELGHTFIDAPVTGGDVGARNGTLTIMVGADGMGFDRARPFLSCFGTNILHVGQVGSGQKMKAVNQVGVALGIVAMTEALVLAQAEGLDFEMTLKVLQGGAAGSWALANYAPRIGRGELAPGFASAHMLKDLRIALDEAPSATSLPALEHAIPLFEQLVALGGNTLGNHALIEVYRRLRPEVS